ncbi:MAG: cytochrome c-type biogenesis protein CcmH [Leptospiraceae bacterium]|nr:cytochrome c-type biogenesis protein CcmH [Leptospiraceae bacterium]MDW8306419.1 cytochrome c-type biogenesis protein CcmH [Leptospiraceae bacterium]
MRFYSLLIFVIFSWAHPLSSGSTHSSLKDPELLKKFQSLSLKLMCRCGCNMPLAYCNHIGHCNAWPMRAAIDSLLTEGRSEEDILEGFVVGFGDLVDTHPAFALARSAEYSYLLPEFRHGMGEKILTKPRQKSLWIFLVLGFLAIGLAGILLIRKKIRNPALIVKEEEERELEESFTEFLRKHPQ